MKAPVRSIALYGHFGSCNPGNASLETVLSLSINTGNAYYGRPSDRRVWQRSSPPHPLQPKASHLGRPLRRQLLGCDRLGECRPFRRIPSQHEQRVQHTGTSGRDREHLLHADADPRETHIDDCRWTTQNLLVAHNDLGESCGILPLYSARRCGSTGCSSNFGTYPRWSPYKGTLEQASTSTEQQLGQDLFGQLELHGSRGRKDHRLGSMAVGSTIKIPPHIGIDREGN